MRFDLESWRKLYIKESLEHRSMSLLARGLRDYLIRFAEEDGTLLRDTDDPGSDITRTLGAKGHEAKLTREAVADLIRIRYLTHENRRLWITRFSDAQGARSPGAKRQEKYMTRRQQIVSSDATTDVSSDTKVTSQKTRRDETRKDESSPKPPRPKGWRRIPADWHPDPSEPLNSKAESFAIDLAEQLASIRDHEYKTPRSDPDACWRTWLRQAIQWAKDRGIKPIRPATTDELRARRARDEADRLERERQAKLQADSADGPDPTAEQVRQLALGVVGS